MNKDELTEKLTQFVTGMNRAKIFAAYQTIATIKIVERAQIENIMPHDDGIVKIISETLWKMFPADHDDRDLIEKLAETIVESFKEITKQVMNGELPDDIPQDLRDILEGK